MATVNETVRASIAAYPLLHNTRSEVLHFLLCVIGNGYSWVNGEVVTSFPDDLKPWTTERFQEQAVKDLERYESSEYLQEIFRTQMEDELRQCLEIITTLDERVNLWTDLKGDVYPQSEYALLMKMPEDVTDDWRQACEQMREYVSERGWKF